MGVFSDIRLEKIDYGKETIPVVIVFDENFLPHASAMLLSLAEHAKRNAVYEIIILYLGISQEKRRTFEELYSEFSNLKIRWVDMENSFPDFQYTGAYGKLSYFRLAIPEILESYSKILYLDADTIVLADVADLFDTDLKGTPLAAVHNGTSYLRLDTGNATGYDVNLYVYFHDILGLSDAEIAKTFNAGILVMDLDAIRRRKDLEKYQANIHRMFQYGDNCLLNIVYKGDQHVLLPFEWNVENFLLDENMVLDKALVKRQFEARKNPRIVHYTDKPFTAKSWRYDPPLAEYYWMYLKKTPYYPAIREKFEKDRVAMGLKPEASVPTWKKILKQIPFLKPAMNLIRKMQKG